MERKDLRAHKRVPVSLPGHLISKDITYSALIKNISESGLCMQLLPRQVPLIFDSTSNIEVGLHISAKENLTVYGKKRWINRVSDINIGIEITSPSLQHRKFVETQLLTFT